MSKASAAATTVRIPFGNRTRVGKPTPDVRFAQLAVRAHHASGRMPLGGSRPSPRCRADPPHARNQGGVEWSMGQLVHWAIGPLGERASLEQGSVCPN